MLEEHLQLAQKTQEQVTASAGGMEQPDAAIETAPQGEQAMTPSSRRRIDTEEQPAATQTEEQAVAPEQPALTQTEEEVVTPQPEQQQAATEPGQVVSIEEVLGASVVNAEGDEVAEIEDVVLGQGDQYYAILSVGGFLGIGDKKVAMPLDQLQLGEDQVYLIDGRDRGPAEADAGVRGGAVPAVQARAKAEPLRERSQRASSGPEPGSGPFATSASHPGRARRTSTAVRDPAAVRSVDRAGARPRPSPRLRQMLPNGRVLEADPDVAAAGDRRLDQRPDVDRKAGDHPGRVRRLAFAAGSDRHRAHRARGGKPEGEAVREHEPVDRHRCAGDGPGEGGAEPQEARLVDGIAGVNAVARGELKAVAHVVLPGSGRRSPPRRPRGSRSGQS